MADTFPTLQTERLLLRAFSPDDAEAYHEIASFPTNNAFTLENTQHKITSLLEGFEKGEMITWVLEYDGEMAGTCGFYRGFANRTGEIGYILKENYKRKGLMREAVEAVLQYGFAQLDLHTITAYTKDENADSIALLTAFGFVRTDTFSDDYRRYELSR